MATSTRHFATFTLKYWRDERWFVGRLREVPGVFGQGESLEELEENSQEAYALMREDEPEPPSRTCTPNRSPFDSVSLRAGRLTLSC